MIGLFTPVIGHCCLDEIKLASFFLAIIISVEVFLLSKGKGDLLSHLEVVEASISLVSWFLITTLADWFKGASSFPCYLL